MVRIEILRKGRGRYSLLWDFLSIARRFFKAIVLVSFLPGWLLIQAVRPWLSIRFGQLVSERIGHFAANTDIYLCEKAIGIGSPNRRAIDIWCYSDSVSNTQLARMWARVLHIWPSVIVRPLMLLDALLPVRNRSAMRWSARDVHCASVRVPSHLFFTAEEEQAGRDGLRSLGVPLGAKFVCFHTRDSGYLEAMCPKGDISFAYHSYRDTSIHGLIPAVLELVGRGYYAIRMGATVADDLPDIDLKVIDYAANGLRSDFLDIYLGARCTFFLSTGSGIDAVAQVFRRPYVYVNLAPLEHVHSWSPSHLFIPRKYWLRREQRFMTFREIIESGAGRFVRTRQFEEVGIELVTNSDEEIVSVVLEMAERLDETWETQEDDEQLQHRFWAEFEGSALHGSVNSRIGAEFLRLHYELLA